MKTSARGVRWPDKLIEMVDNERGEISFSKFTQMVMEQYFEPSESAQEPIVVTPGNLWPGVEAAANGRPRRVRSLDHSKDQDIHGKA